MDEDVIADLKQFITTTVSQQVGSLRDDMNQRFESLHGEMNQRFDDLETKVDTIADAQTVDMADHEQRITKLEQQTA